MGFRFTYPDKDWELTKRSTSRWTTRRCRSCGVAAQYWPKPECTVPLHQQVAEHTARQVKNAHMKERYGIDLDEYTALLAKQNNACAVCEEPLNRDTDEPDIDHDHTTKKVRGIVHHKCNVVLGFAEDDDALLTKAAAYVRRHREVDDE